MSGFRNYYDTSFGSRSRSNDGIKKDEKSTTSRIASKYGGSTSYGTGYQRDSSATRDSTGSYLSAGSIPRIKTTLEKKETNHPPVSYRPINKTTPRSRDPSPVSQSEKSTSSSSYSLNRLYPKPYTRSVSRERLEVTSPVPTISSKYGGRSSITKEDSLSDRYGYKSKDDVSSKYSAISKEDKIPRLGTSRATSREDLSSSSSQKSYISSRFLPKNTIEKSYTAYSRPSSIRSNETSRKSREILNVLHAQQEQEKNRKSISRCSSISSEKSTSKSSLSKDLSKTNKISDETETIAVVTRGTSPLTSNSSQTTSFRKRNEIAKVVEKQITRPKNKESMEDKAIQSDRLDDSTKSSRYSGASRIATAAAPWNSILDMKFSSPTKKDSDQKSKDSESPKSLSRASSTKSLNQSSIKSSDKSKDPKSKTPSLTSIKGKVASLKQNQNSEGKKQLPPQIPKSETNVKQSNNLHSLNPQNKDFRKSVLNMNPDGKIKKIGRRSTSVSSADSDGGEPQNSEATDISENLASCKSFPRSNSNSKLPQRLTTDNGLKTRRSPSSDLSSTASGSEDDGRLKREPESKVSKSVNSSRTSVCLSADELSTDKSIKISSSNKSKNDDSKEAEAKSFLMRALGPVTGYFKNKSYSKNVSDEKVNWMDTSPQKSRENSKSDPHCSEGSEKYSNSKLQKMVPRVDSGEKPWWLDNSNSSSRENGIRKQGNKNSKSVMRHVESGEIPWWLDENAEVPEGVQTYPNWVKPDGTTEDGRVIYKIRKNDSGETSWWLDTSESNTNNSHFMNGEDVVGNEYHERYKLRHIDSGERAWWISSSENIPDQLQKEDKKGNTDVPKNKFRRQDSNEKAWWLQGDNDASEPLGDRASPEGLEMPKNIEGRASPYDNVPETLTKIKRSKNYPLFISKHTNIDDLLGGCQMWSPIIDRIFSYPEANREECTEVSPEQVKIHEGFMNNTEMVRENDGNKAAGTFQKRYRKLDDAALQLYKDGDYGSYLDLEASISEQQEEFEGFQSNKKNSIVLRTQLSVRVHTIIEKLLTSEGRELRRALFSLKQIFQEDKDLVHEFVQNDGLSCLIKVGSEADQNYQNYILRALGQVMLYVDGMNGVMDHNQTIQWLYSLISSKFRLVVKTALKLLLVFVEYTDSNCMLLIKAINTVDYSQGLLPWHNIMRLLRDFDSADTELLIYATTLINKVLNGIPDQDTYYDQTDALEEQGIEAIIQRYMSKPGTDLDLLQQFQIYEAVLQYEDGGEESNGAPIRHLDENVRKTLRHRKSMAETKDRRRSRRHSTGTAPGYGTLGRINGGPLQPSQELDDESSSSQSSGLNNTQLNGSYKDSNKACEVGVTPALRRRRERAERQRSFMQEQQESAALLKQAYDHNGDSSPPHQDLSNGNYTNALQQRITNANNILNRSTSRKDITPLMNAVNKLDSEENLSKQPWILSCYNKNEDKNEDAENGNENERNLLLQIKRENTVKDITQKLANQNIIQTPPDDNKISRIGDMSGLISKAKEGLAKSKSKADVLKNAINDNVPKIEAKKSENELRWEELVTNLNRSLNLCDMDFTDLATDDEVDVLAPAMAINGIPPPPPPLLKANGNTPPPPPPSAKGPPPVPNPPVFGVNLQRTKPIETKIPIKKNKKTVKLFWKEVRDDPISNVKLKSGYIWDELCPVNVDTQKLEHLFESRAKDLITKKQQELNKNKEIIVLDPKRSNAINIGMTKLPPPRSIKTAIMKMDATIMNREGIEKLLTMLPTEEERTKIQEAQAANPDLPLGSAEQFLLTLASISELPARLNLWAFKLDFENSEREIAEPLMDLKQGIEVLKINKTFRGILSTLLSIGNFLNGNEVKGFQIEYLAKVPEVKDTVHKHSLLHHLCHIVMEKFPDATDLYSEIGAVTRASKIDFDELAQNIQRLENDCKASWDHLKLIAKHDWSTMMKVKMSDFLADCAERIILLGVVHRRIINRFHKFLLWLGIPLHQISETKPNEFCRVVSEFALEYRTTRERVLQQLEKKANHRERNKTRGKMITDIGKFRSKEDRADAELRQLLGSDMSDVESIQGGTLPWRRTKKDINRSFNCQINGNLTDGDDEILESLVKTATKGSSRTAPRERKRTRHADRKSLRRTLKNGLSEEEKKHLSAYIKGY